MRLYGYLLVPLLWLCHLPETHARALSAEIALIELPGATLHQVKLRLYWPEQAPEGVLSIQIGRAEVEMWAEPFVGIDWQCPLHHGQGWQCEGEVRSGTQPPLRLAVDLSDALSEVQLSDGPARLHLRRDALTPELTRIDLTQVPLAWLQQWLMQLWPPVRLGEGRLQGEIRIINADTAPFRVETAFALNAGALETDNARIAAAGVNMQAALSFSAGEDGRQITAQGEFSAGEALIGSAYLALPSTPVQWQLDARQSGDTPWQLPQFLWRDGEVLHAQGALGFSADAELDTLELRLQSGDISTWPARYLSGWLGLSGLTGLHMDGMLDADITLSSDGLERLDVRLDGVHFDDAQGRFSLQGLDGRLTHASHGEHGGELTWHSGSIGEIAFGRAHWPLHSRDGLLQTTAPVEVDLLNGKAFLHALRLRPPHAGQGWQLDFGLHLQQLDLAPLSTALGWPAFRGQLTGSIPAARYRDGWLDLDGGLSMSIFDGRIDVTSLVMERPFGVLPTLTLDLSLMNLDLLAITEMFDFGSISGRLDGRIDGLRLVDWSPSAFDAEFHTVPRRGTRQRISQRAVQDISSIGGGGIMHNLQGRLIGLFDDFGYRKIGLRCRLINQTCTMSGLHSAGSGFTIVQGSGLPRLGVVGFNHQVDWPTLVERLSQIADGAAPVVQ